MIDYMRRGKSILPLCRLFSMCKINQTGLFPGMDFKCASNHALHFNRFNIYLLIQFSHEKSLPY